MTISWLFVLFQFMVQELLTKKLHLVAKEYFVIFFFLLLFILN